MLENTPPPPPGKCKVSATQGVEVGTVGRALTNSGFRPRLRLVRLAQTSPPPFGINNQRYAAIMKDPIKHATQF